jgi:hypothetical protein
VISLGTINGLPIQERNRIYLSLIPPSLCQQFALDPAAFTDPEGRPIARVEASPGEPSVRLTIQHRANAPDPVLFLRLDESRYGSLQITWIILSDPEGPRFGVDLDDEGNITDLGARCRNLREEEAALRAGLAPGQIRPGLRMLRPILERIEAFAARLGRPGLILEAFYYHNALAYERQGFGYLAGQQRMEDIHRGFWPGGDLLPRLDGSTPFRATGAEGTQRGRSWAIHDGILGRPWWPPVMFRPIGLRHGICTAPAIPY